MPVRCACRYYFNEGEFKTPNSGLTYFDGHGTLSVYKNHDRDPLLFDNGFKLVFRNMEDTTGCGDFDVRASYTHAHTRAHTGRRTRAHAHAHPLASAHAHLPAPLPTHRVHTRTHLPTSIVRTSFARMAHRLGTCPSSLAGVQAKEARTQRTTP